MKYHFKIHQEEDGRYWSEGIELPHCVTQGDSIHELKMHLKDALDLYLDEPQGSNVTFPLPDESINDSDSIISIPVDCRLAFPIIMKNFRLQKKLTQEEAQHSIGLANRNSYVRLENPGNPKIETLDKVVRAFPDFPIGKCFSARV
ncbi:MAG: type II toxin-antitoxin system HicB family antitoxin [Deltaproteobacteria bacterium]|nr:type II toxin-antitoxin system HicB family antitoxin [Deltaproteobacteria bacterium]